MNKQIPILTYISLMLCIFSTSMYGFEMPNFVRTASPGSYMLGLVQGIWGEVALLSLADTGRDIINHNHRDLPHITYSNKRVIWRITATAAGFLLSNVSYDIWCQYIALIWKHIAPRLNKQALSRGFAHGRGASAIAVIGTMCAINTHCDNADVNDMCCFECGSLMNSMYVADNMYV